MEITIRQATMDDATALADVGAVTFYDTFHTFHSEEDMQKYISATYTVEKVSANLQNPDILYFLAEQEGQAIGYIKILRDVKPDKIGAGRVAELEKIYVRQETLGSGVGKKLMQQAIIACVQEKFDWLFLGVWQDNHRALAFYKAFGWEIFNTRNFILGDTVCDDYLLRLRLS